MKTTLALLLAALLWLPGIAVAQTVTASPPSPTVTCPSSPGTFVTALTASGFPAGILGSTWSITGNSTNFALASPTLNTVNLVVGATCSSSLAGVSVTAQQPSGSGPTASWPVGGIACDRGPNYTGPIPALVTAANWPGGFKCVLNFDATNAAWASTATYIQNCGAGSPTPNVPSTWNFLVVSTLAGNTQLPCNRTTIVADPIDGLNSLLFTSPTSDGVTQSISPTMYWPVTQNASGTPGSVTSWLPNQLYVATKWHTDFNSRNQDGTLTNRGSISIWSDAQQTNFGAGGCCWIAENYTETFEDNPIDQCSQLQNNDLANGGTASSTICSTADVVNSFQTLENLTTGTANSGDPLYHCIHVSGVNLGCVHLNPITGHNNVNAAHDRLYQNTHGKYGAAVATFTINTWIRSILIFSCANYATQGCPGTPVTN